MRMGYMSLRNHLEMIVIVICINDEQYPVILINNSMSFARQIFTLLHELYHLDEY